MVMSKTIAIIGLGYVGLPLAVEFAKNKHRVIGFDINQNRIKDLKSGVDHTLEVSKEELLQSSIKFSSDLNDLEAAQVYIITVPTPVDSSRQPDLSPIIAASKTVGSVLKKGDIVVYESTVYPGCTEEVCVPVLEKQSGLRFNQTFFCGYSPERMNPGDKERTVAKIIKITSGSTPEIADEVDRLYSSIVKVGTHKASSIKVAEAAKVIENAQRDINIAFVNELSIIFNRMGLDTHEVLAAAGTKWNFLNFKPGLVGGHCIGVDPYYLTHKAEKLGYHPQVILSGRRINDGMGQYVANQVIKLMIKRSHKIDNAKVLVLGLTFKEDCPDIRNTRVIDVISELKEFGCVVDIYDPWVNAAEVDHEYGLQMLAENPFHNMSQYQAIVLAVAHKKFKEIDFTKINRDATIVYDLKGILPIQLSDGRL